MNSLERNHVKLLMDGEFLSSTKSIDPISSKVVCDL